MPFIADQLGLQLGRRRQFRKPAIAIKPIAVRDKDAGSEIGCTEKSSVKTPVFV